MKAAMGALLLTGLGAAQAASIQSCGGPSDLLKNAVISVHPDPIDRSLPFTITASGTLGAPLPEVFASADLDATILLMGRKLVDGKLNGKGVAQVDNSLPAGDVELIVGPVKLEKLPGTVDLAGQIHFTDSTGKQVACLAVDLHLPLLVGQTQGQVALPSAVHDPPESCGQRGDHLHDVSVRKIGAMTEVTGTFDEDVSDMSFVLDGTVKAGFVPVHVALNVPVKLKPGFKKGTSPHIRFGPAAVASPEAATSSNSNATVPPKIHVKGTVTWKDAADEEVACLSLSVDSEDEVDVVPSAAGDRETVVVV